MQEVDRDPALRAYGACLAFTHVLTALSWRGDRELPRLLAEGRPAICWPMFEACAEVRVFGASFWTAFPWVYGLAGLLVVGLFARTRASWAMAALAALSTVGVAVLLLDYRLRLNQHLMQNAALLAFLVLPARRDTLRALVLGFYVWAGLLKLNADWLTGAALGEGGLPGVPAGVLPAACAWVVALELLGVFGLFGSAWMHRATLAQLVVFHGFSWGIVGFFYPLLMLALLSIFPLCRAWPPDGQGPRWPPWLAVGWFSLAQLAPRLIPGDPAITGQGRAFALHMFDARVLCEAHMDVRHTTGVIERVVIPTDRGPQRMRCDPVIHAGVARHTCTLPGVVDVDLHLRSRRSTSPDLVPVVDRAAFCTSKPDLGVLWNDWITH